MTDLSLPKEDIRVLLLDGIHPSVKEMFVSSGYTNVDMPTEALQGDALKKELDTTYILGIRSRTKLPQEMIEGTKLLTVGCFGIGTNQVDHSAANAAGIPVFNAPFSSTRSVAELVLGFIFALFRGVPQKNAALHRGEWSKSAKGSNEIRGKTLGIVGYGHIGTQLGLMAESLGMHIRYFDPEPKLNLGSAEPCNSLEELLSISDVVSLHVPETKGTIGMINDTTLAQMKPGSKLVNAGRGKVVDEAALINALESGHISGAALDVFEQEPKGKGEEFSSKLRAFDNVLMTPHIGGSTEEAQENIATEVAAKLIKYVDTGTTHSSVNFPNVNLPVQENCYRYLHVHQNVPGVLRSLNDIFSDSNMNIAGQYLKTQDDIGYVVIDIDKNEDVPPSFLGRLRSIDGTIRARMLY